MPFLTWVLLGLLAIADGINTEAAALHGAIATVHPIASDVAREIVRQGGNAVDAAVAAALTLGVVDTANSGLGGGCFLMIRRPNGKIIAIDGRETAPAAASRDMFVREGKPVPELSQTGALAVGVPGALAAYDLAVRKYGNLPLRVHLQAAADVADRGFSLSRAYADRLQSVAKELSADLGASAVFLHTNGNALAVGEVLVQHDLAVSYRAVAEHGVDWFYRGPFASQLDHWMTQQGGLIRERDLARYRVRLRDPVRSSYRGYEIVGFPPPSSGGVHVAQILNLLERYDLRAMGRESAEFIHTVTEAMKLAFADRAYWLGDPDFTHVPRGLVDKAYASSLASGIHSERASVVSSHGTPSDVAQHWFGKHTTHFSTADSEGNWVACTATINTTFGSKRVVPGTGIVLNNEMDDFSAAAGSSNAFGLVGGEANAVVPRKRPLSSMSPTLVLKDGRPILSVGAAGGPTIISQTLLTILGVVDFGLPVDQALVATRFHHQWRPDELRVERRMNPQVVLELERRGHHVVFENSIGACQAVQDYGGSFRAAHDPRLDGKAIQW